MVKEIRWPKKVQTQLLNAYQYILQNSYQGAEKVKQDILLSISNLSIIRKFIRLISIEKIMTALSGLLNSINTGLAIG